MAPSLRSIGSSKVRLAASISAFSFSNNSLYCQYSFGNPSSYTSSCHVDPILPIIVASSSKATVLSHSIMSAMPSSWTGSTHLASPKDHLSGVSRFFIGCSSCHHPKGYIISYVSCVCNFAGDHSCMAIGPDFLLNWM